MIRRYYEGGHVRLPRTILKSDPHPTTSVAMPRALRALPGAVSHPITMGDLADDYVTTDPALQFFADTAAATTSINRSLNQMLFASGAYPLGIGPFGTIYNPAGVVARPVAGFSWGWILLLGGVGLVAVVAMKGR